MDIKKLNTDESIQGSEHLVNLKHQVNIEFDETYKYFPGKIRTFFNFLLKLIALPIFKLIHYFAYNLKIEGKECLKALRKGKQNLILICNHCMFLDTAFAVMTCFRNTIYIPTVEVTLRIPFVRHIISSFNVIPIPFAPKSLVCFKNAVNTLLTNGKSLLLFPEGALWPYYPSLREFKTGAFRFAVDNNTPILPSCVTYRQRTGLWKLLGKKPLVTYTFLSAIYPDISLQKKKAVNELKQTAYELMKAFLDKHPWNNSDYDGINIIGNENTTKVKEG